MKKYLMTDVAAGLALLATICVGGFTFMEHTTNKLEQELKEKPIQLVRKEMLANNASMAQKTMFERVVKADTNKFEVASKRTETD